MNFLKLVERHRAKQRAMQAARYRHGDKASLAALFDAVGAKRRRKRHKANLKHARAEAAKPRFAEAVEALHHQADTSPIAGVTPPPAPVEPGPPESLAPRRAGQYRALKEPVPVPPAGLASAAPTGKKPKRRLIGIMVPRFAVERPDRGSAPTLEGRVAPRPTGEPADVWRGTPRRGGGRPLSGAESSPSDRIGF